MQKSIPLALLGAALCLWGCSNTVNGAARDAAADTAVVRKSTQRAAAATEHVVATAGNEVKNAGQEIHKAVKNSAAAVVVTPEVKTAIIRDPILNDQRNQINVESKDNVVHLRGHVLTARMKDRATEDVQAVLNHHHRPDKVINDLTVTAG